MDEGTGFEGLDTPFVITRALATLLGAWFVVLLAGATVEAVGSVLPDRRRPPATVAGPGGEEEIHPRSCCWERHPVRDLRGIAWASALPIAGMILVWRRPRIGFMAAAGGWIAWVLLPPAIFVDPTSREPSADWRFWALLLSPPSWLAVAGVKIGPSPPADRVYSRS